MRDRLLFTASRFLWPIHNVVLLLAIGILLGERALADYTYALAVCAPLYFLASFSLPIYMRTQGKRGFFRIELAWLRVLSAAATIPLVGAVSLITPSTQANVFVALWVLKLGDIVFDSVPVYFSARTSDKHRGAKLFLLDGLRVLLAQAALWSCLLFLQKGIVVLLLGVGSINLVVSTCILLAVPSWFGSHIGLARFLAILRRLVRRATPMTISGALLAFLISLPRLLSEPHLTDPERAVFGLAQTIGSGVALLFNGIWLYEFHRIQDSFRAGQLRRLLSINLLLTLIFLSLLIGTSIAMLVAQPTLFSLMHISAPATLLFPVLIVLLGLQHCISVHRDTLKLASHEWTEVRILVASLGAATVVHFGVVYLAGASWPWSVAAMCLVAALVQVLLSYVALSERLRARPRA